LAVHRKSAGAAARFLVALLAGFAVLLSAGAGAATAQKLETGVFDPDTFSGGNPLAFERVANAGAHYVRLTARWANIAPAHRPTTGNPQNPDDFHYAYHWGGLDQEVEQARAAGLTPIIDIFATPDWARADADCSDGEICAPDPSDFGDFAHAAALRYSGRGSEPQVLLWQAWNEANIHQFLMPQFVDGVPVAADIYRDMLSAFANQVKAVDSDNLVITSGLAPLKRPGSTAPLAFSRRLLCMSGRTNPRAACDDPAQFDIWTTHPYTPGNPLHRCPDPDDVCIAGLPAMRRLLRAAEDAGNVRSSFDRVPFWVTEFSWDSKPPDPGGVPLARLGRWTSEAMYRMWDAGVSAVFWFLLRDQPGHGAAPDIFQSGLYFRGNDGLDTDTAKPILRAFRFPFVALPRRGRTFVWGRTPDSEPGEVLIQELHGSHWRDATTLRADEDGIFLKRLNLAPGGELRAVIEDPYAEVSPFRSLPFVATRTKDAQIHVFGSTFPTG